MNLIFKNWRRFQLNEIFNSPVPDDEIEVTMDASWGTNWMFFVNDLPYEMEIAEFYGADGEHPILKEWGVEFSHKGEYDQTDYGLDTGVVVMSTVLKILMDWIKENNNNFFFLKSSSKEEIRTRLYNRLLKNVSKNLGTDYVAENVGAMFGGMQMIVNIGLIERKVDEFIKDSDFRGARKLIADALTKLNVNGFKEGRSVQRIIKIFDKVEQSQVGKGRGWRMREGDEKQ